MATLLSPDVSPGIILLVVVLVAVAGSLLPISPMSPVLVGIALFAGPSLLVPVVLVAAASEVMAKSLIYAAGGQADRVLSPKKRAAMDRVRVYLTGKRSFRLAAIFGSALSGFPPFYVVTVACGVLRLPLRDYLVAGVIGRSGRYAALVLLSRGVAEATLPHFFR